MEATIDKKEEIRADEAIKIERPQLGKISITGLTERQLMVMRYIIEKAKRCFTEQDELKRWYSNDDFVCVLNEIEKRALDQIKL